MDHLSYLYHLYFTLHTPELQASKSATVDCGRG